MSKMFLVLTNIPTPYRSAFYNCLEDQLAKNGMKFHVFYCAKTEPNRQWEFFPEENNYEYTFLKGFHPKFKNFYPHFNRGLFKLIKSLNPTHILMGGAWNAPSVINVCIEKKKIKAKLIFWSEGHFERQRSKSVLIDKFRSYIFNKIDAFVVPNDKSKIYIEHYNKKALIGFLPNTIDERFFSPDLLPAKSELRKDLLIPVNKKVVLLVSTLNDGKGVFEMIQAYNLLIKEQKDKIVLIFLGTGVYKEKLSNYKKEYLLENVFLLGHKTPEEVRNYLHIADIFALPTKFDSNPLTPIEASFMKKPLLLSKLAGNHDELIKEQTGFSLNEISSDCIAEKLTEILNTSDYDLENMGNHAYENVVTNFSRKSASEKLVQFIKTL
jgi:glycosyltransferase involved in cell wall biosynthesis